MKITESQIPDLIKQGKDKEAIDNLYTQVLPKVKKYIMRNSGSAEDAHDVFQDAVLAFYQTVITGKFNPQYKVYGFVYKLCLFRFINKEKKNRRIEFHEDLSDVPEQHFSDLFLSDSWEDESNILKQLFGQLGSKCVELLNYSIIKDMLIEDIVIRMGFPSPTAVSMQIGRCKEKLTQELTKNPRLLDKLKRI